MPYSYDSRGFEGRADGGGRPQQWGDEAAWGSEQRAWFDTSHSPAQLLVRDVRGRDEGSYRCKVHFKASPSWSQRITLSVQGKRRGGINGGRGEAAQSRDTSLSGRR